MDNTFTNLKREIEENYPTPIATVYRRTRLIRNDQQGEMLKGLSELFELIIKFQTIVALAELRTRMPNIIESMKKNTSVLKFLSKPAIGKWVELMRYLCSLEIDKKQCPFISELSRWYNVASNPIGRDITEQLTKIGIPGTSRGKAPVASIIDLLVTFRNKRIGHGARSDKRTLTHLVEAIKNSTAFLLSSATHLTSLQLINVDRIQVSEDKKFLIDATLLNGINPEPFDFRTAKDIELHDVYIFQDNIDDTEMPLVSLNPFLIWQYNEKTNNVEAFFYNDYWKSKLEFLSYESGHFLYHKKLHRSIEELLDLEEAHYFIEDEYSHLNDEERNIRSEELLLRAQIAIDHENHEDAEEFLERSIGFKKSAQSYFELTKVQHLLGESNEKVKETLEKVLDIDPKYQPAKDFLYELSQETETQRPVDYSLINNSFKKEEKFFHPQNVYQALMIKRLRKNAHLVWSIIAMIWMGFSSIIEWYYSLIPLSFLAGGVIMVVVINCVYQARKILERIKLPLKLQLSNMRPDRFELWYDRQLESIFGKFYLSSDGNLLWGKILHEHIKKISFWFFLFSLALFGSIRIGITSDLPTLIMIKRIIDYGLFFMIGVIGCAGAIHTTIFFYRYGNLGLKPLIGSGGKEGVQAISGLSLLFCTVATAIYMIFFVIIWPFLEPGFYFDIFFLLLGFVLIILYIGLVPFMFFRASKEAMRRIQRIYQEHVEDALYQYVRYPEERTLSRYIWLISNDHPIKRLRRWPMSRYQTIGVILLNLLALVFCIYYIVLRLGIDILSLFPLLLSL